MWKKKKAAEIEKKNKWNERSKLTTNNGFYLKLMLFTSHQFQVCWLLHYEINGMHSMNFGMDIIFHFYSFSGAS